MKKKEKEELVSQGYTHVKYSNRKYYSLSKSEYEKIELKDIPKIKVYCHASKTDISKECKKSLKVTRRGEIFKNLTAKEGKKKTSKELVKDKYTHKRYPNRKLYDLSTSEYVVEEEMVKTKDFKVYDNSLKRDVTKYFKL